MRQDGLRTVVGQRAIDHRLDSRRHGVHAAQRDLFVAAGVLDHLGGGQRHVVVVELAGLDLAGILDQIILPQLGDLVHIPVGGIFGQQLDIGIFRKRLVEACGAALRAGVAERALGHDHVALAADALEQRVGDDRAHQDVVRLQEGGDPDIILGDGRVHLDDRDALADHLLDRVDQRVDAEGLDGDEIPLLGGHVVDRLALLVDAQAAVKPGDLDAQPLAPLLGGRFALGAPCRAQAGVGKGRSQGFAKSRTGAATLGNRRNGGLITGRIAGT